MNIAVCYGRRRMCEESSQIVASGAVMNVQLGSGMPEPMTGYLRNSKILAVLFQTPHVPLVRQDVVASRSHHILAGCCRLRDRKFFNLLHRNGVAVLLAPFRVIPKETRLSYVGTSYMNAARFKVDVLPPQGHEFSHPETQINLDPDG